MRSGTSSLGSIRAWALAITDWLENGEFDTWSEFARHLAKSTASTDLDRWEDRKVRPCDHLWPGIEGDVRAGLDWPNLEPVLKWAAHSNFTEEWTEAHGPGWWLAVEPKSIEGRRALVIVAGWRATWAGDDPNAWGQVVASWFVEADPSELEAAVVAFVEGGADRRGSIHLPSRVSEESAIKSMGSDPKEAQHDLRRRFSDEERRWRSPMRSRRHTEAIPGPFSAGSRFDRSAELSLLFLELATEKTETDAEKISCVERASSRVS